MPILLSQEGRFYNIPVDVLAKSEIKRENLPAEVRGPTPEGYDKLVTGRIAEPILSGGDEGPGKDVEGRFCVYRWWCDGWGNCWTRWVCF